jgi:hypothetical protein
MKRVCLVLVYMLAILGALKAYDYYLILTFPAAIPDEDADRPTMRTGELYPYTGIHMQPYMRERGAEVLWDKTYPDRDVTSGEYGFWIDHALENWPAKEPNEIRIILTGGSAAQGWGGRTNADMFYKLLPAQLSKDTGCKVEVINLAMGASIIYQNFIALNKWGHALEPDAIISFSGNNEIAVPETTRSDDAGFMSGFAAGAALQYVLRYSASPDWLKDLAQVFPGIVRRTRFGSLVRFLYLEKYITEWREAYVVNREAPHDGPISREEQKRLFEKTKPATLADVVKSIGVPLYIHSLESMARDFPDIPVFAVFQPLGARSAEYDFLRTEVSARTKGVTFYDMQAEWARKDFYPGSFVNSDSLHLSNVGHRLVADYLASYLLPFVQERCRHLQGR